MLKIAHIINPVTVRETSDLFYAQPITFKSMLGAKEFSSGKTEVALHAVNFPEDDSIVPEYFSKCDYLKRSVLDIGQFKIKKKLPLIADILYSLKDIKTDYVVYTNADIGLMPFFYEFIRNKIESGSDTLIINRRVLSNNPHRPLTEIFAETGKPHAGFDCFVFRKELLEKFQLGTVCIGANWIGRAMISNLITHSRKVEIFKDQHLTFHIGEEGPWLSGKFLDYDLHNSKEVKKIIKTLIPICAKDEQKKELMKIEQHIENWYKPSTTVQQSLFKKLTSVFSRNK